MMNQTLTPLFRKFSFVFLIAGCCLLCSCRTTNDIAYDYRVSKDTLQASIKRFLSANPAYSFPRNDSAWKPYAPADSVMAWSFEDDGHIHGSYRNLKEREEYIYFKNGPEEVYELHYYMDRDYWNKNPHFSRLILAAVVKKGGKWRYCPDHVFGVFFRGRKRVERRLEKELLNKLPFKFEKME